MRKTTVQVMTSGLQEFPLLSLGRFIRLLGHVSTHKGQEGCTLKTFRLAFCRVIVKLIHRKDNKVTERRETETRTMDRQSKVNEVGPSPFLSKLSILCALIVRT